MSHGKSDEELIRTTRNTSRFCVENPHITWVLLIFTCLWGFYGYQSMPQRKDPEIPVRRAVALCPWPGMPALKVEEQITRRLERVVSQNPHVVTVESISRTGLSMVFLDISEKVRDTRKEFDDIDLRLKAVADLPDGSGPIVFIKDFGDTAALMLTVASPPTDEVQLDLRARDVRKAVENVRRERSSHLAGQPFTVVHCFPLDMTDVRPVRLAAEELARLLREHGFAGDPRIIQGPGFVGLDGVSEATDQEILDYVSDYVQQTVLLSEIHPDAWEPVIVRDPGGTREALERVALERYSYRELEDFTLALERALRTVPEVARVDRVGILEEMVYLYYSQERLASYGISPPFDLPNVLAGRNVTSSGGVKEQQGRVIPVTASGEFSSLDEIGGTAIEVSSGAPVYLRDLVQVVPGYEGPPRFLNFLTWQDDQGTWHRSRAITLAVQMRSGEKIERFGEAVDRTLDEVTGRLPRDLVVRRTSDQPRQVRESVNLFMKSLWEAILLVVVVSWIGFWEWRSALLMALSIPITLAMTFGFMHLSGIDLQQVSIASLIIALGLLVDDPVVAGNAIRDELARGVPRPIAAWLGPTRLATAILYATVTNVVAYLPFLILSGDTGLFLYSLPVVIGWSLVASRVVSMTFIPFLGRYLLRPQQQPPLHTLRERGLYGLYYRAGRWAVDHRWKVMLSSLLFLALGWGCFAGLKTQFFPKDLSYLSYVDVFLPADAPLLATDEMTRKAEDIIRQVAGHHAKLETLTTFEGGGGPRFWFSVDPELEQTNYSQILIEVKDKHDTEHLVEPLQQELHRGLAGARVDVRQLETGTPVGLPVGVRITGEDIATLRRLAAEVKEILRSSPLALRVRDDWGEDVMTANLEIDSDRANLAGITNLDVARSSEAALSGVQVTTLREGERRIPVVARLAMSERSQLADLRNLYVYSSQGEQKVPLGLIARIDMRLAPHQIRRRNYFRTVTVGCYPQPGHLPSEVVEQIQEPVERLAGTLPSGYSTKMVGEAAEAEKGFAELAMAMLVSVVAIYLALVFQFRNAVKPFLVFAAVPYGVAGALLALAVMRTPFGFMAFLGIASLVGVIVSHIIVLFDYIEEAHARGESFLDSLLDAGIARLRPVLITVGATVIALVPLATHGGPVWEPLCYTQIGGLCVATVITLVLVPVMFAIFVLDLKLLHWTAEEPADSSLP
ncbi:MAG: efflux RND transporter permease subunit [Armatimonadetes bacterium]|nr:efflux RND transporter permease subunit [Armatimonadota bacterium]